MARELRLHEGTLRPSLVKELEVFRAAGQRVSSYYLDLHGHHGNDVEVAKLTVKNAMATQRKRLEQLELPPANRHALQHDWESVQELALLTAGRRDVRAVACFVTSDAGFARVFALPWSVGDRAFFEDQFVLWPLHQILDQADRYAVCLTDKDDARLLLVHLEQIEEVSTLCDEVPGRVRFPDPFGESHYQHKRIEHFHHHFERVADALLRLFQREPFEHLIIGGLWEKLPQFEGHLHRYVRDRIVARWEIDVHASTLEVLQRALTEEQNVLRREAQNIWKNIQDRRTDRGALGPDETFAPLWQRRVQALLVEPEARSAGFRCQSCGRLQSSGGECLECGGKLNELADVFEEAIHDAIEQSALVRLWKDPALKDVASLAALKRF
jgi:peptide chain release factor subunit 1